MSVEEVPHAFSFWLEGKLVEFIFQHEIQDHQFLGSQDLSAPRSCIDFTFGYREETSKPDVFIPRSLFCSIV